MTLSAVVVGLIVLAFIAQSAHANARTGPTKRLHTFNDYAKASSGKADQQEDVLGDKGVWKHILLKDGMANRRLLQNSQAPYTAPSRPFPSPSPLTRSPDPSPPTTRPSSNYDSTPSSSQASAQSQQAQAEANAKASQQAQQYGSSAASQHLAQAQAQQSQAQRQAQAQQEQYNAQ